MVVGAQQAAQKKRDHQVVRDHDRKRHTGDDDHGGGGRKPADEGDQGKKIMPGKQRQGEHVEIGIGFVADERPDRQRQSESRKG